jgi:hypothetical protein
MREAGTHERRRAVFGELGGWTGNADGVGFNMIII